MYNMYNLEKLDNILNQVWNEIYINTENYKENIKTIVNEHEFMTQNEIVEMKKYNIIKNILKEINCKSKIYNPYRKLINSIYDLNNIINWYPNPTFKDPNNAIANESFCANLIGKPREMQNDPYLFHSDIIVGGLFLMGSNKYYPEHYHPAYETWLILHGNAKWKLGNGDWQIKKPGEHFTCNKNESHAIQMGEESLLALWAWTGDLSTWAKWV